tara:strand:+ start:28358 stop:28789 length:432 start_codon:yes stop_codon:yes gene_type:complete
MFKNINLQYIFSYSGTIPYLFILLDKLFFHLIDLVIIRQFAIYYSVIIIVFIGSINWNLKKNLSNVLVFHGLFPSVFGMIIVIMTLFSISNLVIFFLLINFIFLQLIIDYLLIYKTNDYKFIFFKVRLPLTFIIVFLLLIILK